MCHTGRVAAAQRFNGWWFASATEAERWPLLLGVGGRCGCCLFCIESLLFVLFNCRFLVVRAIAVVCACLS